MQHLLHELRRETITMMWPHKRNGQNKDTKKQIISKILKEKDLWDDWMVQPSNVR
jgi:hypothetical protein